MIKVRVILGSGLALGYRQVVLDGLSPRIIIKAGAEFTALQRNWVKGVNLTL